MSGMMDNVKTVNSVLRTLIALAVVAAAGIAGWLGISQYYAADWERQATESKLSEVQSQLQQREKTIADQQAALRDSEQLLAKKDDQIRGLSSDLAQTQLELQKLDTAMRLLKVDHRLADIKVLDTGTNDKGQPIVDVSFQEINDEGQAIDQAKQFRLIGDEIRVDNWEVLFEDKFIEQADIHRSTSLCLFKRIYGNIEGPTGGHAIETIGTRPTAYARGKPLSDFEKQIWDDFWEIANDSKRAQELGIRGASGKSLFIKAQKGKTYPIVLRASGGISLDTRRTAQ